MFNRNNRREYGIIHNSVFKKKIAMYDILSCPRLIESHAMGSLYTNNNARIETIVGFRNDISILNLFNFSKLL
jgi:hypothetical protein